ncbi:MAG: RNA polymerase sigma factor [Porphyromonadaceae bacterium]|nr:MAG: RNA polymerase sigma factor [Porphyromonadaceae bacterium]
MDQSIINQLVIRAQNRDSAAFAELIGLTQRFAFGTVFRIVGNAEESRDIVQEAYIRVWSNLHKFSGQVTFQTWFFSILRHLSIDWLRRSKIRQSAVNHQLPIADNNHPGTLLEGSELNQLIQNWILTLPGTQQLVFILRDVEDLPIREVRDQTGLTESSIKSNLYLVRKKLAAYLKLKGYQIP